MCFMMIKDDKSESYATSGWVVTERFVEGKRDCKALLHVHRNQIVENIKTDYHTASRLRILFTLATHYGWEIKTSDVTFDFYQLQSLNREVYIKPPDDIHVRGTLWKLRVAVCRLGEAGKKWYEAIYTWLISTGMVRSDMDPAFFYYVKHGKLTGMLALHGDDALYGGDNKFYKDVIKPMKAKLMFEKRMEDEYRVLDWNVEQDQGNIYIYIFYM